MMNQSILVGYDPHCCMFERKRKGGVYFQLQYNLLEVKEEQSLLEITRKKPNVASS